MLAHWRQFTKVIVLLALLLAGIGVFSLGYHELDQKLHTWHMQLVGYNGDIVKAGRAIGDVQVRGNYAYVAAGIQKRGLVIVDVKDPANPTIVSELVLEDATSFELKVNQEGTLVALTNELIDYNFKDRAAAGKSFFGLTFVDVADKAHPKIVGRWENKAPDGHHEGCHNVFLHKHYAYCASFGGSGGRGVVILDISDPANAKEIGVLTNPKMDLGEHADIWTHDLWVWEHPSGRTFAFVANGHAGLQIWDVTAPSYPLRISSWTEWGTDLWVHSAVPSPSGKITVLGPETETGISGFLAILDTSDIQNPKLLSTWSIPGHAWQPKKFQGFYSWSPHNFDVTEDKIYLGNYAGGVWVIDISDPTNPKTIASFGPESYKPIPDGVPGVDSIGLKPHVPNSWTAQEENGYIYVSDIFTGLYILKLDMEQKSELAQKPEEKKPESTKGTLQKIKLEDLVKTYSVSAPAISPDGKWIAFSSNKAGNSDIYLMSSEGGEWKRLTLSPEAEVNPVWSPDGKKILYMADVGGNEVYDIYAISPEGGEPVNLTNTPDIDERGYRWSPDGKLIAFNAAKKGETYDIYLMNADGKERKQLTNTPVAEFLSDWSSDGKTLAFTRNSDPRYSEGYLLSLENGSEQKLALPSEARNSLGNFSPDGTKITFETDTKGNSDIGIFDLKSNTSTWLANDPTKDESVGDWSPDGQSIVYVENNEGNFEIKLKPSTGGEAKTIALKKGINGAPRWFPDGKKLALTYSGPTQPTNIWTTTLDGNETKQLTFSAPPNVDPQVLVNSELVKYTSFDGRDIYGWLYKPKSFKSGEKAPAILLIHGGPSAQSLNGWNAQIQFFVNNGYVVLAPNVRGSTGYGKTFEDLNDKDWGGGDLKDVIAAREYLIKAGIADEKHIGITGGSYGGYMTFMALTQYPDLWAAGVSSVGVVNLETLWKTTTGSLRYYLLSELGKPEENQQLYHDRSPLNFVDKIKAPLLILVGERDPRVPLSEFEQIKQKLEASKIPFESKVYSGEGHGFRKEENRLDSLQRTIEFFDKYLKSEHTSKVTTEKERRTYSVTQYLDIQSSGSGRLSPDGTTLLYTNNATGTSQVYRLNLKTNQVTQLTNYEDGVGLVGWAPDGSGFIFGKGSGGNERTQLYWMSADGKDVIDLSQNPNSIHSFSDWSPDGSKIAFVSNRRNPAYFDIYVQDLKTKGTTMVYQSDGNNSVASWSPDGKYLILSVASSNSDNNLYLLNLETKEAKLLTPHEGIALYNAGQWTPDSKGFFVLSDQDREFTNLAYIDIFEGKLSFIEDYDWDLEDVQLSRDGKILATLANVEGYNLLRLWSWPEREQLITPNMPAGLLGSLRFSQDSKKLTFTFSGSVRTSEVWIYDLETQEVRQLTQSSLAGIDPTSFAEPELIKYPTFDGRQIPALFYLPKGAKKDGTLPVIIDIHGGPEGQSQPSFSRVNQFFLNHGYVILRPNVRGSTGYGKTYTHLDDVQHREESVRDIAYAVEWLKQSGYIDPKKVVAMGGSYGGYMVLACLTLYPDLFAAGVDTVGIANFVTFLERTSPYRRKLRESEYGSLDKDRDLLASISPIHKVDKIKAPLFVIHGANDPRVPISEAEQIVEAVKKQGGIVEYMRFEDEGHGLAKRENQIKAYTRVVEFLDQYLKH